MNDFSPEDEPEDDDDASSGEQRRSWMAQAAGRLAAGPVRAAARAVRGPLEDVADNMLSAPEVARIIDRMLAGPLPEELVQSLTRHHVLERVAAGLAESGELERLAMAALASPHTVQITDDAVTALIDSHVLERIARQVAESGEIERLASVALASPRALTIADDVVATTISSKVVERVATRIADSGEIERLVSAALTSPRTLKITDDAVTALIESRIAERVASRIADSGEIERLTTATLTSPRTLKIADSVLASDMTQHAMRHIGSSPELREAIATQTSGLAGEVAAGLRVSAARLDDRAERVGRRPARTVRPVWGGVATRAFALAIDAGVSLTLYMALVGMAALISSLVGDLRPEWLVAALLAVGWSTLVAAYFVLFWATTGQTPGMRLLRVRVQRTNGQRLSFWRSLVRVIGLVLSIIPMFLGFVPVLFTERRRGFADWLAGTVVIHTEDVLGELVRSPVALALDAGAPIITEPGHE